MEAIIDQQQSREYVQNQDLSTLSVALGRGQLHTIETLEGTQRSAVSTRFSELSVSGEQLVNILNSLPSSALSQGLAKGVLPLNISDFDGTMIRDSSGAFKLDYAIDRDFFQPIIRPRLDEMLTHFGLTSSRGESEDSARARSRDVRAVKEAYETWLRVPNINHEDRLSTTKAFYEMCSWIFAGYTAEEIHEFTRNVIVDTGYGANFFDKAREMVNSLRALGIETSLVSATFQPVVEEAARYLGIAAENVVGMNLETDENGRYLPVMKEPVTFRHGKVAAAELLISRYLDANGISGAASDFKPLLAMGDSPSKTDEQLLAMAEIAVAVEPQTPKDAEHARKLYANGRRGFFVDFERTIGGELAEKFDRNLDVQKLPEGKFL